MKAELMTVYMVLPANKIGPNARFVRAFIGSSDRGHHVEHHATHAPGRLPAR